MPQGLLFRLWCWGCLVFHDFYLQSTGLAKRVGFGGIETVVVLLEAHARANTYTQIHRPVHMCIYLYTCVYAYVIIFAYTYRYTHIYIYININKHMNIYIYVYIYRVHMYLMWNTRHGYDS